MSGPELRCDREAEPRGHAGRQRLRRLVTHLGKLRELQDAVDVRFDERLVVAEQDAVVHDVVDERQLRFEPDAELDQRRHGPVDAHRAARRDEDVRHHLHQGGLAAAVGADQRDFLAALDPQRYAVEDRPLAAAPHAPAQQIEERSLEIVVELFLRAALQRDVAQIDRGTHVRRGP